MSLQNFRKLQCVILEIFEQLHIFVLACTLLFFYFFLNKVRYSFDQMNNQGFKGT